MPKLLILGGTGDAAKFIAQAAELPGVELVSSLAGRTPKPNMPTVGQVRIGGFGGEAGLLEFLRREQIDVLIDVTHPFAAQISWNAANAAKAHGIPHLLVNRPGWEPQPDDRWIETPTHEAAADLLPGLAKWVFLTIGRQELAAFAHLPDLWFLMRMITPPDPPIPVGEVILQQGPFSVEAEIELMQRYGIAAIVSKNSGGNATYAKIIAARELAIPVVMIPRPMLPETAIVNSIDAALDWLRSRI